MRKDVVERCSASNLELTMPPTDTGSLSDAIIAMEFYQRAKEQSRAEVQELEEELQKAIEEIGRTKDELQASPSFPQTGNLKGRRQRQRSSQKKGPG